MIDSALGWHTRGRAFESRLLQQVLRFVGRINTLQYVGLMGYAAHEGEGCDHLIGSIVRSWLWFPIALQLGVPHCASSVITASSC